MRSARIITGMVLVLVATACGTAAAPSPCRGEVSSPENPPSHHDPELEARIPDTVADEPLEVQSVCANVAEIGGINMTLEFLESLGVEVADVTYATHVPAINDAPDVSISAFRYRGAAEDAVRSALIQAADGAGQPLREGTRAGKDIHTGEEGLAGTTFYVADDTLYLLSGDDEQVDELLAGLP